MNNEQFYPTPEELLKEAFKDVDFCRIGSILEPSAGTGNICDYIVKKADQHPFYNRSLDIDCIEINENRRASLKGKGYKVVYDNFLTFHTHKQYDLIAMNPPFAEGAKHLLKALDMQKNGGNIICILNAETLRNLYSNERKDLYRKLEDYDAEITYHSSAFSQAEVRTDVEVAVIRVNIPEAEDVSYIFEDLRKSPKYAEKSTEWEDTEIAVNDIVEAIICQYEMELDAGIRLIHEYWGMEPHIMNTFDDSSYNRPILTLKVGDRDLSINRFVERVRQKYWSALFQNPKFVKGMTSNMQSQYLSKVGELKGYDFTKYNIRTIQIEMSKHMVSSIEDCIIRLFDELSYRHSMGCEKNIHYFNGWKTNESWIINKKVIIPMYDVFDDIFHKFRYSYGVTQKLSDIEKVFDYLSGHISGNSDLPGILQRAENLQESKNLEFKYFTCTFYKKGTCHIVFKDEELLKKFNIFGAQHKGWLPPGYGKKAYDEMEQEGKEVIDSFEGKNSYERTCARSDHYLYDPNGQVMRLEMAG